VDQQRCCQGLNPAYFKKINELEKIARAARCMCSRAGDLIITAVQLHYRRSMATGVHDGLVEKFADGEIDQFRSVLKCTVPGRRYNK
jgi:hypothetical protein